MVNQYNIKLDKSTIIHGLVIALLVMVVDALRYAATFVFDLLDLTIETLNYFMGFCVAVLIVIGILYLLNKGD